MSEKMAVRCLYCGAEMVEHRSGKWYECERCEAQSPYAESPEEAYSAAMARYVEANRVLTLAEWRMVERDLEDDVLFTPYWVEHRHPNGFWNQWVDCWEDHQSFAAQLEKYGTEWRPWARKPTTKEKEETPW